MNNVLITDFAHRKLGEGLEKMGFEVDFFPDINLSHVHEIIGDYYGIIINSKIKMDKALIDKALKLKFIGRLGSGLEIIDIPYAQSKHIHVINSPEGNCNAVAEHAIGMLLMLCNNLYDANTEVKRFEWNREANRGIELKDKTIGIIGFGHTGSTLAKKLSSWEMNIIVHDKYISDFELDHPYLKEVSLSQIQKEADIISFHLPLSVETKHYFDNTFLENCAKEVILINTSRGQVMHTPSLIQGLKSGKIMGLCLDVFENEKVGTYTDNEREMYGELLSFYNVIVSPHIAGWTAESLERIAQVLLDKIRRIID